MKKLLYTLVALFITASASGQITITSSDMPVKNDTIRYSNVNLTNLPTDYQNTGANYSWDFSSMNSESQGLYEYKPATSIHILYGLFGLNSFGLKFVDSFGIGTYQLEDWYDFYQNSSSVFKAVGTGFKVMGTPIPSWYSDVDEIYQFPLEYNDRDSSNYSFEASLLTLATYTRTGYRINDVDGWGEIITPYGTFNCLRVKTTILRIDSIRIDPFPGVELPAIKEIEYKWLANGVKMPVFEIKGNDLMGNFTPISIRYRDVYKEIIDPRRPRADFNADLLTPTNVDTVRFSNQTTTVPIGVSYKWTFTPNTITYLDSTDDTSEDPVVRFDSVGYYDVKLMATNVFGTHDTLMPNYINVSKAVGINIPYQGNNIIRIYPNPSNGEINIEIPGKEKGMLSIEIINLKGQIIYRKELGKTTQTIYKLNLPNKRVGSYLIRIYDEHNLVQEKLINLY